MRGQSSLYHFQTGAMACQSPISSCSQSVPSDWYIYVYLPRYHNKQDFFLTYFFFQLLSTLALVHTHIPTKVSNKKQSGFLTYYFFLQLLSALYLLLPNHYPILKDNHGISEALVYNQARLINK